MTEQSTVLRAPKPDTQPPAGYRYVAHPEDRTWKIIGTADARPCRYRSNTTGSCRQPSVVAVDRAHAVGRGTDFWHYCAAHMYGRWIENGSVWRWVLEARLPR